jgi:hypothetical protein
MRPSHPVRHRRPLRNHRFFCSRSRTALLEERFRMQTRFMPLAFAAASFLVYRQVATRRDAQLRLTFASHLQKSYIIYMIAFCCQGSLYLCVRVESARLRAHRELCVEKISGLGDVVAPGSHRTCRHGSFKPTDRNQPPYNGCAISALVCCVTAELRSRTARKVRGNFCQMLCSCTMRI